MKATVTVSELKEINIDQREVVRLAIELIENKFELPQDSYLKSGKVCVEREYHTSHSWYEEEEIRKATPEDIKALEAIELLRDTY